MASAAFSLSPTRLAPEPKSPARSRLKGLGATGWLAVAAFALLLIAAIGGQSVWHVDPLAQNVAVRLQNPSPEHPLGTDNYGRDILSRLIEGARWSLLGAATVCVGTSLAGFIIGATAAAGNRLADQMIGRGIETLLAMPGLVMALALSSILGPSFENLLVALIVTSWPGYARMYRALVLKQRGQQYVEGAEAVGAGRVRIVVRHILPNVVGPALVLASADFGKVILGLAALSFLGFGMQPPTPEWGQMINEARPYFQTRPWQMLAPGLCIVLTVLAVNLIGDAARDLADPRTVGR